MNELKLIHPTIQFKEAYLDMIDDFNQHKEKPRPSTINLNHEDFPLMLKKLEDFKQGIGLKENQVEHSTYWLVIHNRVIGAVNIRHRLNDYLLKFDGHIGGGISPSERGKGYATKMLALALEILKDNGLDRVLVTCNKGNLASEKTILKNRGVFESETVEENGNIVRRFWIQI